MTPFAPPRGQVCETCFFWQEWPAPNDRGERVGACRAFPAPFNGRTEMSAGFYCGHWRGNASVRCGGCRWYNKSECPRTLVCPDDSPLDRYTPFAEAFPCERYEEAEK